MTNPSFDPALGDDDEKPLDPAVLRVQARLRRLILIAGLTLGLGIFAVFAAILYRIATHDTTAKPFAARAAAPSLTLAQMGLPADAKLVSTAADGGRVVLTYEHSGGHTLVFVDGKGLVVTGKLDLPQ